MRAALYHRVSTVDQNAEIARDDLRLAARARGFDVVLDVEEKGSGARNDRPGLQQVMAAALRGKVDAVLVWKLDRFGRSALDVLTNVRALANAGCRFVAVTQGLDIHAEGDATSRLILSVLAAVAEFERDLISDRTRAAIRHAQAHGTKTGRPIGRQPISIDVDRARALLRDDGLSYGAAARELGVSRSWLRRALPGWQKRDTRKGAGKPAKIPAESGPG